MGKDIHYVPNGDGWRLSLKRTLNRDTHDPRLRPVAIVPGYGMNAFIFGYHPTGLSMEDYLAECGFEVWSLNLRAQGASIREGGKKAYGMREVSLIDLPTAFDYIIQNSRSEAERIDAIGCSLGGTMVYVYAALHESPKLGAIVAMGAPLRWVEIHPVLRFAFSWPRLAGMFRLSHTRSLARCLLPLLSKIPGLLHIYIHPEIVDLSRADLLIRTVEDPNPVLNREISEWVINLDLVIDGQNVTERFADVTNPLLAMLANADGIVPPATALSALERASSEVKDVITVGDEQIKLAHADMFVSRYSQEMVFQPIADWLIKQL